MDKRKVSPRDHTHSARDRAAFTLYALALLCLLALGLSWLVADEYDSSAGGLTVTSWARVLAVFWGMPLGVSAVLAAAVLRVPTSDFDGRASKLAFDQRILLRLLEAGRAMRLAIAAGLVTAALLVLAVACGISTLSWILLDDPPGTPGEVLNALLRMTVGFSPILLLVGIAVIAARRLVKGARAAPNEGPGR